MACINDWCMDKNTEKHWSDDIKSFINRTGSVDKPLQQTSIAHHNRTVIFITWVKVVLSEFFTRHKSDKLKSSYPNIKKINKYQLR